MEGIKRVLFYTPASTAFIHWSTSLQIVPWNQRMKGGPVLWPKTSLSLFSPTEECCSSNFSLSLFHSISPSTGSFYQNTNMLIYPKKTIILIKLNSPYFSLKPLFYFSSLSYQKYLAVLPLLFSPLLLLLFFLYFTAMWLSSPSVLPNRSLHPWYIYPVNCSFNKKLWALNRCQWRASESHFSFLLPWE